jgi:hypothetical protein
MESLWKVVWTLIAIQSFCILMFQCYSFFARMKLDAEGSYRPVFMNSFSVLWYMYSVTLTICMYFYSEKIRNYVNCLMDFNKKCVGKEGSV